MKKLTLIVVVFLSVLTLTSCKISDFIGGKEDESQDDNEIKYTTILSELNQIDLEIDETYNLKYVVKDTSGIVVSVVDESVVSIEEKVLTGLKKGETNLELKLENKVQIVKVSVHDKGALSSTFTFNKERLSGKTLAAFGDSVTAPATIGGARTYVENFATKYKMDMANNYAIGGTTATYMYEGSNIYKEYAGSTTAIDGVRVVKNAYDKGELNELDYVFIAYGHNDQYFQAPITASGDDVYDVNSFDSCHSFKGSYRYMINTLKLANPDVRIIILGCTYSQYDLANPSRYGKTYNYDDYRQAMKEVAEEFNLTYIDPWDHLKLYYDNYDNKIFYKDSVHLSAEGHELLANFIFNYR